MTPNEQQLDTLVGKEVTVAIAYGSVHALLSKHVDPMVSTYRATVMDEFGDSISSLCDIKFKAVDVKSILDKGTHSIIILNPNPS